MPNPYIARPSDPFAPPPYRADGSVFTCFVMESTYDRLNAILERDLIDPTGGRQFFFATLPVAIVTYVDIARSSSLAADVNQRGYYTERDLMIWIPTIRIAPEFEWPHLGWYVPDVWVDNSIAVIEGREGFGYPKGQAHVSVPDHDGHGGFATRTQVFPGQADQPVTEAIINRVTGSGPLRVAEEWTSAAAIRDGFLAAAGVDVKDHVPHPEVPSLALGSSLIPHEVFLLRQFRSGSDPSVNERVDVSVSSVEDFTLRNAGLLDGDWTVEFPSFATLQIADELGIADRQAAMFAYTVTVDCTLGAPSIVWTSAED